MKIFQYKVRWEASSNHLFEGESDWITYDKLNKTVSEIKNELIQTGPIPLALETALEESGFSYSLETREIDYQ